MMKTIRKYLIPIFFVIFFIVVTFLYRNYNSETKKAAEVNNPVKLETYHSGSGWGYKILKQGRTYIDQQYIPAIQGKIPFASQNEAEKVGKVVLEKVKNMEVPYVSMQILDSLKITY